MSNSTDGNPRRKKRRVDEDQKNVVEQSENVVLAARPSVNCQSAKRICAIKKLHPQLLGKIIEETSFRDRLRVELVSKQFLLAARKYGWPADTVRSINCMMVSKDCREMKTRRVSDKHVIALIRLAGPRLRELYLSSFHFNRNYLNGSSICAFFRITPNISVLNLDFVKLLPPDLDLITKHLSMKLVEVSFYCSFKFYLESSYRNRVDASKLIDAAFRRFFIACIKLEVLTIRFWETFYSYDLGACLDTLPTTIRSLKVFSENITNEAIVFIGDRCSLHLQELNFHATRLDSLDPLMICKFTKLNTLRLDYSLSKLPSRAECKSILSSQLYSVFNDDCLRSITEVCHSIQTLELTRCLFITEVGLRTLANLPNLVNLKLLSIEGCSDDLFKAIKHPEKIERFEISGVDGLTDAFIHGLVDCCKFLKCLKIYGIYNKAPIFTDHAFRRLAELPKLAELVICDAVDLSDQTLSAIFRNGTLKKLSVHCQWITDELVIEAIAYCKSLFFLNVSFCSLVTNRSLEALNAEMERRNVEGARRRSRFQINCYGTEITNEARAKAKWIDFI